MLIAHISDIHLRCWRGVRPTAFVGKRLLGGLNLLLNRGHEFPPAVAHALFADLRQLAPDHLIVSGDLTNLSLLPEFELARRMLSSLDLPASAVTVVPGNHDAYTLMAAAKDHFGTTMAEFLHGDPPGHASAYPLVQLRDGIAIVALSTARPSAPLMAVGTLGAAQLGAAEALLRHPEVQTRFRLVVLHHAPQSPHVRWHARLTDAQAFIDMIGRVGADLVVHGHLHRVSHEHLRGPDGAVPVVGVTSSTWISHDPARRARYNIYNVDAERRTFRTRARAYDVDQQAFVDGPGVTELAGG